MTERTPKATGMMHHGVPVGELLGLSSLAGARLIAGEGGLGRIVQRLNVMEVPDILAWVKANELLLTTGYPLRNTPQSLERLVADLDERGLAALGIKLGRYVDDLPEQMVRQADALDFPLIRLPDHVGFDDILNQVLTDILNRQAGILARAEEAHRALVQVVLAGGGLQEVTDLVADLLGIAVAACDDAGTILAESGPASARAVLKAEGDPEVCVPVVAGGHHHGRIVAAGVDGPIRDADIRILERAATVAALVVTKQEAVAAVESKYRADFLRDVLTGRASDHDSAGRVRTACRAFGWNLDRTVHVVLATLDEPDPERPVHDRLLAAWIGAARRQDGRAAVAGFSGEVVAVVGAETDRARLVRDAASAFSEACGSRSFSTGVSRAATGREALPEAYAQAVKAVRVGRQLHGAGATADFDHLGVYRILSLVEDAAELHAFVKETLGELAEDGDPEVVDLRQTLEILLETNLNVAEASRRLHFHYNTLRYRIAKLERMLGPWTEDANLRLNLSLALHVLRMRGI